MGDHRGTLSPTGINHRYSQLTGADTGRVNSIFWNLSVSPLEVVNRNGCLG